MLNNCISNFKSYTIYKILNQARTRVIRNPYKPNQIGNTIDLLGKPDWPICPSCERLSLRKRKTKESKTRRRRAERFP